MLLAAQYIAIIAQTWLYYDFEVLFQRGKFEQFANMKVKLRLAFAFFMMLLITRTVYFTFIKFQSFINAAESNSLMVHFDE